MRELSGVISDRIRRKRDHELGGETAEPATSAEAQRPQTARPDEDPEEARNEAFEPCHCAEAARQKASRA
jgi:hypothetical protein